MDSQRRRPLQRARLRPNSPAAPAPASSRPLACAPRATPRSDYHSGPHPAAAPSPIHLTDHPTAPPALPASPPAPPVSSPIPPHFRSDETSAAASQAAGYVHEAKIAQAARIGIRRWRTPSIARSRPSQGCPPAMFPISQPRFSVPPSNSMQTSAFSKHRPPRTGNLSNHPHLGATDNY